MAQEIKRCAFCGETRPHPKVHILPRAMRVSAQDQPLLSFNSYELFRIKKSPTGLYDDNIWCDQCEKNSSYLDEHISRTILNRQNIYRINLRGTSAFECKNADPVCLSLFTLSVLWRASKSTLGELKNFSLGPYQDDVRDILLNNDVEALSKYPLIIFCDRKPEDCMILPFRHPNRYFNVFCGAGFQFCIKMSKTPLPKEFECFTLKARKAVILVPFDFMKTYRPVLGPNAKKCERKFGRPKFRRTRQ
jgi:hypothetical protein